MASVSRWRNGARQDRLCPEGFPVRRRGLEIEDVGGGVHLRVHVKPRAKVSRVGEVRQDALDVAVSAPPVEGAANAVLVQTLARYFGLPRRAVSIVSGLASRAKLVRLDGISAADVLAKLNG